MKQTTALIFVIILCLLIGAGPTHATGTAEAKGPRAVFQEKSVEFDPVVAGTEVTHQFVMRNEGSAILKIKNLGSTWGCSAISSVRDIPPGGEGRIKVTIYTSAYGGQKVRKRITVRTNENVDTRHYLYMSGIVDHFASITPEYVHLTGLPGEPVQEQVTILPSEKYPFSIISTRARWGTNMIYDLVPNPEGAGYILIVTNTKDVTGSYRDIIYLATDSTLKRELRVFVRGTIYAPVKKTSQETVPRGSEQNSVLQ